MNTESYPATDASVSVKWWGAASAVTASPLALAARTAAIDPAVDRWRKCIRLPRGAVSRARAMSRITISSSASAGIPGTPSRDDHSPSCMCPPAASDASSQCWARVTPRADAYSSARRISRPSCTPAPSSVNRRTPSSAISAIAASSTPRRPLVMAPATRTSHTDVRPSSSTSRTADAQSMAGSVLGMATTAV